MRTSLLTFAWLAVAPALALADRPITETSPAPPTPSRLELLVTSTAFNANGPIPVEHTCDGASATPPLAWAEVPRGTTSIAVLMDDADAPNGTFTHWLVTGISPLTHTLASGGGLPSGAVASSNSKGDAGYAAPCPTRGRHRYYFHVFALDTSIAQPGSKAELLRAIKGHVLADGQLIGTYQRTTTP